MKRGPDLYPPGSINVDGVIYCGSVSDDSGDTFHFFGSDKKAICLTRIYTESRSQWNPDFISAADKLLPCFKTFSYTAITGGISKRKCSFEPIVCDMTLEDVIRKLKYDVDNS